MATSIKKYLYVIIRFLPMLSCVWVMTGCGSSQHNDLAAFESIKDTQQRLSQQSQTLTPVKWWLKFNDDNLTKLVETGLTNNASLQSSLAKVRQAAYAVSISAANLGPDLRLEVSSNSEMDSLGTIKSASFELASRWELDIWGRLGALEERAQWDYLAKQALHATRNNAIAGAIATTWFTYLSELDKKAIFKIQFERTKNALTVVKRRFAAGKNSITDIWQQKRLLESISVQQVQNGSRIKTLTKELITLVDLNELPALENFSFPQLKKISYQGISFQQLQQRPDIQQAYANLRAADANLANAVADQFPRLTLRATYGTNKSNAISLFDDWAGNLISALVLPIIDNGQRKSRVKQQELQSKIALLDFKDVWLQALLDVERRIINEERFYIVVEKLAKQRDLTKKTEDLLSVKYLHGKSTYLALLRAQEINLLLERQLFDARLALVNNRVGLYRELSHGQFSDELPFLKLKLTNNSGQYE